jgi:hypothetical protein
MVEELIIHIGAYKTGSTSFQHCLYNYEDENTAYIEVLPKAFAIHLREQEASNHFFYYWLFDEQRTGNIDNLPINELTNFKDKQIAIRLRKTIFYSQQAYKFKKVIKDHLISQIQSNKKRLILSSEVLCNCSLEYKQNLVNFFKSYGVKNIKVVCVVRDPVEIARAKFTHKFVFALRYGGEWKDINFLTHRDKRGNSSLSYLPSSKQLNYWRDIVGKENLTVLPYSKDINKKLYEFCGVKTIHKNINVTNSITTLRMINYAVKKDLIKTKNLLNKFPIRFNRLMPVIKMSLDYDRDTTNISKIPLNYFIEYADYSQVEYLKKEYGISFKSYEDYTKEEKTTEYKDAYELINDFSKITKEDISYLIKDHNLESTELDDVIKEMDRKSRRLLNNYLA